MGFFNKIAKTVGQGVGDVLTLGTDRIKGSPMETLGQSFGTIATGGIGGLPGFGGSKSPGVPGPATTSPGQILEQTGGAVLLANIVSGADPDTALASYLGISPDKLTEYIGKLDQADSAAIGGIRKQLQQIQTNTNTLNTAANKLVADYPNIMSQSIQRYGSMADDTIKPILDQAMAKVGAAYSANGQLSSGATAAAAARAATGIGYDKLNYATGLAEKDYSNHAAEIEALRGFQQKMLGQGAQYGQTAADSIRKNNAASQDLYTKESYDANKTAASENNALFGSLGTLGGTALGYTIGGPIGGAMGSTIGKSLMNANPKTNAVSYGGENSRSTETLG